MNKGSGENWLNGMRELGAPGMVANTREKLVGKLKIGNKVETTRLNRGVQNKHTGGGERKGTVSRTARFR